MIRFSIRVIQSLFNEPHPLRLVHMPLQLREVWMKQPWPI